MYLRVWNNYELKNMFTKKLQDSSFVNHLVQKFQNPSKGITRAFITNPNNWGEGVDEMIKYYNLPIKEYGNYWYSVYAEGNEHTKYFKNQEEIDDYLESLMGQEYQQRLRNLRAQRNRMMLQDSYWDWVFK